MKTLAMVLLLAVCVGLPVSGSAQSTPSLDRVEALSQEGRMEEARDMLLAWWDSDGRNASRRDVQRGLWLRGRLTVDPAQAALDFRRLVIEYPGGPYSDQAMFRLAQIAYATGDSATAAANVERLIREYPTSPVRREAEAWLATAGPVPKGVTPPATAPAPAAGASRPAPGRTAAPESAAAPTGQYSVQLGAFSSEARARTLLSRVTDAGVEGGRLVTVPGSDLIRVRVGVFDSPEGAGAILRRLQDLGFTAALARDAHREERVRR